MVETGLAEVEQARAEVERQALAHHHGAVSRSHAIAAGMSRNQIDRRVRRGQWLPLGPRGWYVVSACQADPMAALTAATNALNGPAWGPSALALFDLGPHPATPTVASNRRYGGAGVTPVHVSGLAQLHRTRVQGIETVTAAVAVVAAGRWRRSEIELHTLIDTAIRKEVSTWDEVESMLKRFPRRGRAGSTRMRQVLADHEVDPALPLSNWGREFVAGVVDCGLPRPRMEYRIVDGSCRLIAQVDAAYPRHRYAIELDSHAYHLNPEAFERDRRRDGNLAQLGWLVRRFTWRQWQHQRPWVIATIRADLAARPRGRALDAFNMPMPVRIRKSTAPARDVR